MAEAKNYVALAIARAVTDAGKALIETGSRLHREATETAPQEDRDA